MEEGAMIALIVCVVVFVVVAIVAIVGVILWKRRFRRALRRRTTTRPTSNMSVISDTIVASKVNYRVSRDMLALPAGDKDVSVNELPGNQDGALAPPPPIGVVVPPRLPV